MNGDGAKRLWGLGIGHDLAIRGEDTRRVLVLALTNLERAVGGLRWTVVLDTDTIVDVLAQLRCLGISRVAHLHAELVGTHEAIRVSVHNILMLEQCD